MKTLIKIYTLVLVLSHTAHGMNSDTSRASFQHEENSQSPVDTYNENYELPHDLLLVLPPALSYNQVTGLPTNTSIGHPIPSLLSVPDEHLSKAISFIQNEYYLKAFTELRLFKDLSCNHQQELKSLKEALISAQEKSDDQQYELWENVNRLGYASCFCALLNEPLKSILPEPPNTDLALFSTTAYIVYSCYQHAQRAKQLDLLQKQFKTLSTAPPMYTIILPPQKMVMTYAAKAENQLSMTLDNKQKKE